MCNQREAIYEENYLGFQIRIEQDEDAESPRSWDNLGTMVCEHLHYNLGDFNCDKWQEKEQYYPMEKNEDGEEVDIDFADNKERFLHFIREREDIVALPLYLYDHSGLRMATSTAGMVDVQWDVSSVGYIYITHDRIKKEMATPVGKKKNPSLRAIKKITPKVVARTESLLRGEVETYDDYLVGDVFGYIVEKDGEQVDSCWGYYPEHSPLRGKEDYDYCLKEARGVVDWKIKESKKKKVAKK